LQMIVRGERPGDVVVGLEGVDWVVLWREEIDSVVAIGLIEADDIGAGGKVAFLQVERIFGAADFDVLAHQASDELRDAGGIALIIGNEEGGGRFIEPFAIGVEIFFVEVVEELAGIGGGVIESGEGGRFVVVEIVASGPGDFSGGRWKRTIPFARSFFAGEKPGECFGGAVTERFVAPSDRVVVHGDGIKEEFGEAFAEIPRGDAGHALAR